MNRNLIRYYIFFYGFFLLLPFVVVKGNYAMELVAQEKKDGRPEVKEEDVEIQLPKPIKKTMDLFSCIHAINKGFLEILYDRDSRVCLGKVVNKKATIEAIRHNLDNLIEAIDKYYELKKFNKQESDSKKSKGSFNISAILASAQQDQCSDELAQSETQKLIKQLTQQLREIKKLLPCELNNKFDDNIFNAMALFNSIFSENVSAHSHKNVQTLRENMRKFIEQKERVQIAVNQPPKEIKPYVSYIPTILMIIKWLPQGAVNTTLDWLPVDKLTLLPFLGIDEQALNTIKTILPVIKELLAEKSLISSSTEAIEKFLQDETIQKVLNAVIKVAEATQANAYFESVQHCSFIEFLETLKHNHANSLGLLEDDYIIKQKKGIDKADVPVGSTITYDEYTTRKTNALISKALFDSELNRIIFSVVEKTDDWKGFIELQKKLEMLHEKKAASMVKILFNIENLSDKRKKSNEKEKEHQQQHQNYDLQIDQLQVELNELKKVDSKNVITIDEVPKTDTVSTDNSPQEQQNPNDQGWFSTVYSYVPSRTALNPMFYWRKKEPDSEKIKVKKSEDESDDYSDVDGMSESDSETETMQLIKKIEEKFKTIVPMTNKLKDSLEELIKDNKKAEEDLENNYNKELVSKLSVLYKKRRTELKNLRIQKNHLPWLAVVEYIQKRYEIAHKNEIVMNTGDMFDIQIEDLPGLMDKTLQKILTLQQQSDKLYWFTVFRKMQYDYEIEAEKENLNLMMAMFNMAKINTHNKYTMDDNEFGKFKKSKLQYLENLKNLRKPDKMREIFDTSKNLQPVLGQPDLRHMFNPLERKMLAAECK